MSEIIIILFTLGHIWIWGYNIFYTALTLGLGRMRRETDDLFQSSAENKTR
jgi:hypothetical protein